MPAGSLPFLAGLAWCDELPGLFPVSEDRREWDDLVVVDWDEAEPEAANDFKNGWSMGGIVEAARTGAMTPRDPGENRVPILAPSARVRTRRDPAVPTPGRAVETWFVGDPSRDLEGPWYEREAWRMHAGTGLRSSMGAQATRDTVLEALATASRVVISGHAIVQGGLGLQLADGILRPLDILRSAPSCAAEVFLSCCSAGIMDPAEVHDELLGLTSVLLAAGARQVLAPMVPVHDLPAASLGIGSAWAIGEGRSLRDAYGRVLRRYEVQADAGFDVTIEPVPAEALEDDCPHRSDLVEPRRVSSLRVLDTVRQHAVFASEPSARRRDRADGG